MSRLRRALAAAVLPLVLAGLPERATRPGADHTAAATDPAGRTPGRVLLTARRGRCDLRRDGDGVRAVRV